MTFGDRLRELRLAKGLTQTDLASRADLEQSAIARWETGPDMPRLGPFQRLCVALEVRCTAFEGCEFAESEEKRGRGRPAKKPERSPKKGARKS